MVKILNKLGLIACITLIISCFLPWVYYADIQKTFTGFFSEQNMYGKPGRFLILIAVISLVLMLLPKIWAKRTNLFVAALGLGYAIKTYILYTGCYNAYCPEQKPGIFLMVISTFIMLLSAAFPDLSLHIPQEEEVIV